jgi:hemoglobin
MNRPRSCAGPLAALLLSWLATTTHAQQSLYDAIGGEAALKAVVDELVLIMESDDRINFTFAETDMPKFKRLLFEQLCNLSGGPCQYTGRSMRESHDKLKITNAQFNALAEDLYLAFDRVGVPYRVQNKMMAMLAPMQRDIVK